MPKRVLEGKVVSDKGDKTITVLVERRVKDQLYKKYIRRSAKYMAHDESNACKIGDIVQIEECPRISKRKSWRVIDGGDAAGAARPKKAAPKKTEEKKSEAKKTEAEKPAAKKADDKKAAAKKADAKKTEKKKPAAKKATKAAKDKKD